MPKASDINTADKVKPIVPETTPAEQAAFNIDPHLISFNMSEPFYGGVLRILRKQETKEIPTAGVLVKKGELRLYWNREFCAGLIKEGPKKVKGLLKHECQHLIFGHCTTRMLKPHNIANIAADLAINGMIPRDELPDCGLWPGKPATFDDPVLNKIAQMPTGKSQEWYFSELMSDPETKDALTSGEGEWGEMDSHEGWGESEEEIEIVEGRIKAAVEQAAKECDKTGNWGSVPSEMQKKIRDMISNEVDWRKVLRNWAGRTRSVNRSSSWRRINKRLPGLATGAVRGYTSHLAVYIDQSASVSDDEQAKLFAELKNLAGRRSFDIYPFDTQVDVDNVVKVTRKSSLTPFRSRAGGTNFDVVMEHFKQHKDKYDGLVILTDGECSTPPLPPRGKRRLWILTPSGRQMFEKTSHDTIVRLKVDAGPE